MGSCKDGLSDLKRIRRALERSRELGHFLGSRGGSWWFVFISAVPGADCHMNTTSGRGLSLGPQPWPPVRPKCCAVGARVGLHASGTAEMRCLKVLWGAGQKMDFSV